MPFLKLWNFEIFSKHIWWLKMLIKSDCLGVSKSVSTHQRGVPGTQVIWGLPAYCISRICALKCYPCLLIWRSATINSVHFYRVNSRLTINRPTYSILSLNEYVLSHGAGTMVKRYFFLLYKYCTVWSIVEYPFFSFSLTFHRKKKKILAMRLNLGKDLILHNFDELHLSFFVSKKSSIVSFWEFWFIRIC